MTVKTALKNCIDSISQTSKMIFLDPFRGYVYFFTENPSKDHFFGPPQQRFQQHVTPKLHFLQLAPTKIYICLWKKCDLYNSTFNRVWLKTVITVKFALKNSIDSISETLKS